MIEVVALACTLMAPLRCEEVKLSFAAETITPYTCFMYGQTELAKWKIEHPGWVIKDGFKCGDSTRKMVGI